MILSASRALRYEDISLNPVYAIKDIFTEFLGLDFPISVAEYIKEHTTVNGEEQFGTVKNSTETVAKWREGMAWKVTLNHFYFTFALINS